MPFKFHVFWRREEILFQVVVLFYVLIVKSWKVIGCQNTHGCYSVILWILVDLARSQRGAKIVVQLLSFCCWVFQETCVQLFFAIGGHGCA